MGGWGGGGVQDESCDLGGERSTSPGGERGQEERTGEICQRESRMDVRSEHNHLRPTDLS